jgi:hypothetical protein
VRAWELQESDNSGSCSILTGWLRRMVRWLVLSLLVLKLGPGVVEVVKAHALPLVAAVCGLAVVGFAWRRLQKRRDGKLRDG